MKEIKEYDTAAGNFYAKQQFKSLPLEAWDVFALQFGKWCKGLEEVASITSFGISQKWEGVPHLEKEILQKDSVVVITDPHLNIVYASENMFAMSGYRPKEIIGKNPKIFQGKDTCKKTVLEIGKAVKSHNSFETVILNYRKDGSTYNCWIKASPVKDEKGNIVNFIAFEREVA